MRVSYAPATHFEHDAFIYSSDDEYVTALAPVVEAALAAGSEVVAAIGRRNASLLADALGAAGTKVSWIDAQEWYRRPARTIAGYERTLRARPPGTFVIGEVQFGQTPRELGEWTRYEAALNRLFERYSAHVVCPYDTRVLPSSVVADAERTHPMLFGAAARRSSARYTEPEQFFASFPNLAAVPERPVDAVVAGPASLRSARQRFEAMAAGTALTTSHVHELTVAISEVLTNALLHGGGRADVRMWVADELVCVVDDRGEATADWMTGLDTPTLDADGGFGLWFARQVFDHVEIANSPEGGLRVVLSAELPGGADPTGL